MSGDQLAKRARALSGALATWGSRVAKSMPTGQEVKQGMSKAGTRAKAWGKGVAENVRTMDITDVQNSVRSGIRRISASSDIPADAEVVASLVLIRMGGRLIVWIMRRTTPISAVHGVPSMRE